MTNSDHELPEYLQNQALPTPVPVPAGNIEYVTQQGGTAPANLNSYSTNTVPLSQPLYGANFIQSVFRFLAKYARFRGYASKGEFWWMVVAYFGLVVILSIIESITGSDQTFTTLSSVLFLLFIVPCLSLTCRRLHDVGISGWMMLIIIVPGIGFLTLGILLALSQDPAKRRAIWDDNSGPSLPVTVQ